MIDAHIHIGRDNGKKPNLPQELHIRHTLRMYAQLGITQLRDGGDQDMCGLLARSLAAEYGIHLETPVYALSSAGGYGSFLGESVSGIREIKAALTRLFSYAPDHIKIIQSGIVSFDRLGEISAGGFSAHALSYIISCAHDHGLPVMVHCNGSAAVREAISAGADSIEHGYFIDADVIRLMKIHNTIWVPTFAPLANYCKSTVVSSTQKQVIQKTLSLQRENLLLARKEQVSLSIGSDAGAYGVLHGHGTQDEYSIYAQYGVQEDAISSWHASHTNGNP